jgi:Flp pilus assembly protein TadG
MTRSSSDRRPSTTGGFDEGAIALVAAVIIPLMLVLCGIAIDVGRWYVEVQKVQNAADSAALAGVTWMPNYFNNAQTKAIASSAQNGYPNSGSSSVTVIKGQNASELMVTVSSTISNTFGTLFGNPTTTVVRGALADYQGTALMGSPCNTLGNEPPGTTYANADQPQGNAIPGSPAGYASCQDPTPNFWSAIEGPATEKVQGDRYMTTVCNSSTTDCVDPNDLTPPTAPYPNKEYKESGYFYVVRVGANAIDHDVKIQIYDPAYVNTGQSCEALTGTYDNDMNPFAPDAAARYDNVADSGFCPGDSDPGGSGTQPGLTTSFVMRGRSADYVPEHSAPVADSSGVVGASCIKQFRGVTSAPTASSGHLDASNTSNYEAQLARVFHQWVDLCTFHPTITGDYYLQVRTNVSYGGTPESVKAGTTPIEYSGNPAAYADSGNSVNGRGANAYALRAIVDPTAASQPSQRNADVSVAGFERMPVYQNATASTALFNLLQVKPDAAGKDFYFSFFDAGDASGSGTVKVIRPAENIALGQTALPGCKSVKGGVTTNITGNNCQSTITSTSNNGRLQTMTVPVPSGYTCNGTSPGGCWFQVEISFSSGSVHDFTTWTGTIGGDTVRLLK